MTRPRPAADLAFHLGSVTLRRRMLVLGVLVVVGGVLTGWAAHHDQGSARTRALRQRHDALDGCRDADPTGTADCDRMIGTDVAIAPRPDADSLTEGPAHAVAPMALVALLMALAAVPVATAAQRDGVLADAASTSSTRARAAVGHVAGIAGATTLAAGALVTLTAGLAVAVIVLGGGGGPSAHALGTLVVAEARVVATASAVAFVGAALAVLARSGATATVVLVAAPLGAELAIQVATGGTWQLFPGGLIATVVTGHAPTTAASAHHAGVVAAATAAAWVGLPALSAAALAVRSRSAIT